MQEQNLKQMQEHIDFMVTKFQETIKKFDDLKELMSKLHIFINDMSLKVSTNQNEHDKLAQSFMSFSENSSSAHMTSKDRIDTTVRAINELVKRHESLSNDNVNLSSAINSLNIWQCKIDSQMKSFLNHTYYDVLNSRIDSQKKESDTQNASHQAAINESILAHGNLKNIVSQISDDLNRHANVANSANDLANTAAQHYSVLKNKLNEGLASLSNSIDSTIDKKISAIPTPSIPDYSAQIKAVETQHEPIRFDAANAKLRSENTEKKLFLLEKKVEQLQLVLDKLKLGG